MNEYITEAVVLSAKPYHEFDRMVDFYTKDLGRLEARVVGGAKITSKLSPHLDRFNLVTLRLIEKNNFTVADAITVDRFLKLKTSPQSFEVASTLAFLLKEAVPYNLQDLRLWHELLRSLKRGHFDFRLFLKLLGYDPSSAACSLCDKKAIKYFFPGDHGFLCAACSAKIPRKDLVCIR